MLSEVEDDTRACRLSPHEEEPVDLQSEAIAAENLVSAQHVL